MDITPDVNVETLIETYPQAAGFLADRQVVCIVCGEPYWGTLGDLMAHKKVADPAALLADLRDFLAAAD